MLCLFSSGLRLTDSIQQEVEAAGISNPLFQSLPGRMADYLVTSRSDNTNVKYFSYFKKWENFYQNSRRLSFTSISDSCGIIFDGFNG